MIIRADKDQELLQKTLDLLELTEHNRNLAEKYLDLSEPENEELLETAEIQNLRKPAKTGARDIYYNFLKKTEERNEPLAGRFIRLVARIGGSTARYIVSLNGYQKDFEYTEKYLTPIQDAAIRAEYIAWREATLFEREFLFLIEMGRQDPSSLIRMRELCYDQDAVNTKMFLTAIYLHCVKPLEDTKSRLRLPAGKEDKRAEDDPARIQEMREYLEGRLIGNIDGMFKGGDEPKGDDLDLLKNFVRESDPGEPVPPEVWAVLSGRQRFSYLMKFLTGLAFLAVEHSNRFVSMIRLSMALDKENTASLPLDACQNMGEEWFLRHIEALKEIMPVSGENYIRWTVMRKQDRLLIQASKDTPGAFQNALKGIPAEHYGYLSMQLKEGNPKLYRELKEQITEEYRRLAAREVTEKFKTGQAEAERYLLEELELEDILPYVNEWRAMYFYTYDRDRKIHGYLENGLEKLYRRALILECLRQNDGYFRMYWLAPEPDNGKGENNYKRLIDSGQIHAILTLMDEERVPAQYQMEFLGSTYANFYDYSNQEVHQSDTGMQRCVDALAARHPDWSKEYEEAAKGKAADARVLAIRVMAEAGEKYKEVLLSCASDSAKQVQGILRMIYAKHPEWEADILALLKSKKAAVRETAVRVLEAWGVEQYTEPLSQAMEAEKTKKVKELIQGLLSPEGQETKERTLDDLAAELLFGGRKRRLSWFLTRRQTVVHKKDGEEATEDYVAAILTAYADMSIPGFHADAKRLAEELIPEELAACVRELYDVWLEEGAQAKKKWVLYAASIHGGEPIVPVLYTQIQEWAKGTRGAIAAEAVRALALNGTSTALLQVDQISRKSRFRQVKTAAAAALTYAAEQLGITKEELEDRIVPNLGFDERMEQTFDYGRRKFQVVLTPALTLEVYDEKGKRLKNLPAPGKQDDPETAGASNAAWKLLKKQLKAVVSNQTLRLEQALGLGRCWKTEPWQELFVKNPVMRQFAAGLIWGVYENETLQQTFRYMEDGSFNTVDEEEYELPAEGIIGLVHPIELSEELLAAWKEQLSDYEIVQPVEQLERPVYRVTEEEKDKTELTRFHGLALNGLSLSGKLLNMGWYRGEILDGGSYDTFGRMDRGVAVKLTFSGCCVGYENEEVTVGEVSFHKPGEAKRVGYTYETERYMLKEVSPRYFSEIVLQVARATASSHSAE